MSRLTLAVPPFDADNNMVLSYDEYEQYYNAKGSDDSLCTYKEEDYLLNTRITDCSSVAYCYNSEKGGYDNDLCNPRETCAKVKVEQEDGTTELFASCVLSKYCDDSNRKGYWTYTKLNIIDF